MGLLIDGNQGFGVVGIGAASAAGSYCDSRPLRDRIQAQVDRDLKEADRLSTKAAKGKRLLEILADKPELEECLNLVRELGF